MSDEKEDKPEDFTVFRLNSARHLFGDLTDEATVRACREGMARAIGAGTLPGVDARESILSAARGVAQMFDSPHFASEMAVMVEGIRALSTLAIEMASLAAAFPPVPAAEIFRILSSDAYKGFVEDMSASESIRHAVLNSQMPFTDESDKEM